MPGHWGHNSKYDIPEAELDGPNTFHPTEKDNRPASKDHLSLIKLAFGSPKAGSTSTRFPSLSHRVCDRKFQSDSIYHWLRILADVYQYPMRGVRKAWSIVHGPEAIVPPVSNFPIAEYLFDS